MSHLGLIDYGMGNLHSVQRALERLGATVRSVHHASDLEACDALVLPGVGSFDPAMERLHGAGLVDPIRRSCDAGRPLLGICLGLQLLFDSSEEGQRPGLGLLAGCVRALPKVPHHPIPHMGWAPLLPASPSPLLPLQFDGEAWVYFVHSYAADCLDPTIVTARVTYAGTPVTAAVWSGSVSACQFHPEKSGPVGEAMLARWLRWLEQGGRTAEP
ncbi:MAG: imidazole glycerol phosphate synthase subunit HisH [Cyanobacteriota bacterium]|nr:imidazole glycerol phosphate synthase subunit HisH [Cyanobacteriota bacterium]